MKLYVVAIRDSAMQAYNRPYFVPALGLAIRQFGDEVNRQAEDNQLYRHPEDFELHHIAMWDEENGTFQTDGTEKCLMRGKDAKTPE